MTEDSNQNTTPKSQDSSAGIPAREATTETTKSSTGPTLESLTAEIKEKEAKYLYLYADFDNYKKRSVKEREELMKFGWESIARDLVGVVDNLDRVVKTFQNSNQSDANSKAVFEGIQMTLDHFLKTLEKRGMRRLDSIQKPFDPHYHEAVGQDVSDAPQGTIIREEEKGYLLHGRLLRPARVILSMGKPNA
jgi:molecular chaperone GrpE